MMRSAARCFRGGREAEAVASSTSGNGSGVGEVGRWAISMILGPKTERITMRDVASGRSACLCIFWEEYWHMICAAFSTGRVGPEQLRARAGARCGENSCCSSLAKMQQRKSAALGYATACVASRMVWSAHFVGGWWRIASRPVDARTDDRCRPALVGDGFVGMQPGRFLLARRFGMPTQPLRSRHGPVLVVLFHVWPRDEIGQTCRTALVDTSDDFGSGPAK